MKMLPNPSAGLSRARLRILAVFIVFAALILTTIFYSAKRPGRIGTLEIRGTAAFKEQVAKSLTLLEMRSPQSYGIVTAYIGRISQATHSGMAAYENPPTLELNDRTAFFSITWCASSIAHDSIHSKLYNDYLKLHPGTRVPDNVWTGADSEKRCCAHQTRVLQQLGAPSNEIRWSSGNTNQYWEIDYSKRNW